MIEAFGGWGKKRLNRVFDVIGFVYPDYCYPSRKQGKKRKIAASAIASTPKPKKVKVLTHRPKRAETAEVSKPAEGSSASGSDCPALVGAREKLAKVSKPKVITEQQKAETTEVLKRPAEARAKTAEEPKSKKLAEQPKILSPPQETELPKVIEISAITLKRRRMASVFVSVSTRGSLGRRVNCRCVSQPRWVGARRNTRGSNKGNRGSCCPTPMADALAVGGYKRSRGRE
jgi:hypothetical protein